MEAFPKTEHGFFHLTPVGWVRRDVEPFPQDRVETWAYEMQCPAEDAKEQVSLTRTWVKPGLPPDSCAAFHACFGEPVQPNLERNVLLECAV